MKRMLVPMIVAALIVAVAGFDFWTSAELIGSILFTLPLATCALQTSRRLLWGAAVAACILTIVAEFWGLNRSDEVVTIGSRQSRSSIRTAKRTTREWEQRFDPSRSLGCQSEESSRNRLRQFAQAAHADGSRETGCRRAQG